MNADRSRRSFLSSAGLALASIPLVANGQREKVQFATPDMKTFESGDLVWPKRPGAYVFYRDESATYEEERDTWISERNAFVSEKASRTNLTSEDREELERLAKMEFREFLAIYEADEDPSRPGEYSDSGGRGLYVGHVGIVDVDPDGTPWIVEALMRKGVVRSKYVDWLNSRQGNLVWHGRVTGLDQMQRAAIALEARKHVGKPYDFWNFDLDDDSKFYCSKLVWLAINRSNGFSIDGKNRTDRWFWFSPKQLLYQDRISRLHDPGRYGSA